MRSFMVQTLRSTSPTCVLVVVTWRALSAMSWHTHALELLVSVDITHVKTMVGVSLHMVDALLGCNVGAAIGVEGEGGLPGLDVGQQGWVVE